MEYVVAGVLGLMGAGIGAGAYALLAIDRERKTAGTDAGEKPKITPAALGQALRCLAWKQWLLLAAVALLIGAASIRVLLLGETPPAVIRLLAVAILLVPAMIIDLESHRIPNWLVLTMLGLGAVLLGVEFLFYPGDAKGQLLASGAGLLCCLVLFYLMARLTKDGIGMGDVKLIAAEGWLVGLTLTLVAALCSLLCSTAAAAVLLLTKKKKAKDQIAFGPFLFFGYIIALLICSV